MKINMLGRDIVVTREAMLSDGYCLSTVNHAQRLASGSETYTVSKPTEESGGAIWLRGHIPFCSQCKTANEVKSRITDYIGRHFPSRIVDWHQGRMPKEMMGQIVSSLAKADREFIGVAFGFMKYNQMPLHMQAIFDRNSMATASGEIVSTDFSDAMKKSRVILVDTAVLFEAWQLLGSGPLYERNRLVADFDKKKIMTPFPATYIAFSEGINQHLIEHFFDNMPTDIFGTGSIKGVFFYPRGEERSGVMEFDIVASPEKPDGMGSADATGPRVFLWAALLRAIQDKVFVTNTSPEFERERDAYFHSLSRGRPERQAPAPFYVVRVNPNSSFRDRAASYGKRHINWTHRWEVAGHWRTYQDGKRVWIASYVKGPEDKPLVQSVHVYGSEMAANVRANFPQKMLSRFVAWVRSFGSGTA